MASLFKEVESGTKKPKTPDLGPQGPVMVSDSSHISSLIEEVLREQQATPEELTQWAGNRTKLNEEVPWIVEQVVGAKLTERRFKAMVEGVLNPKQLGSFINGLTDRQYSGVWRVATFEIAPGTTIRMDGERRANDGRLGTADDDISFVGTNVNTDSAPQTKATVRWVVKWIDAAGAQENKYDIHGQPIKAMDLTPEAIAQMGGGATVRVLATLAEGQTTMARAMDKLADAVSAPSEAPTPEPAKAAAPHWKVVAKEREATAAAAAVAKKAAEKTKPTDGSV